MSARGSALRFPTSARSVSELTLKSELFRATWASHRVEPPPASGLQQVRHPEVGDFELSFEKFQVLGSPDQTLVISHAEPGSAGEQALILLATMHGSTTTPSA